MGYNFDLKEKDCNLRVTRLASKKNDDPLTHPYRLYHKNSVLIRPFHHFPDSKKEENIDEEETEPATQKLHPSSLFIQLINYDDDKEALAAFDTFSLIGPYADVQPPRRFCCSPHRHGRVRSSR